MIAVRQALSTSKQCALWLVTSGEVGPAFTLLCLFRKFNNEILCHDLRKKRCKNGQDDVFWELFRASEFRVRPPTLFKAPTSLALGLKHELYLPSLISMLGRLNNESSCSAVAYWHLVLLAHCETLKFSPSYCFFNGMVNTFSKKAFTVAQSFLQHLHNSQFVKYWESMKNPPAEEFWNHLSGWVPVWDLISPSLQLRESA